MNSILARIQASQQANPVLQKAADGGPITDDGKKTAAVATDMIQGAENMPDVTKDPNTSDIADIGKAGEEVVNDEITPAAPIHDNEDNPDVQEILATAETVIKTANAIMPMVAAFSQMADEDLNSLFEKQAAATDLTNDQMFNLIEKMASNGSPVASYFLDFCAGCDMVMNKIANDAAALEAQGVSPEEAEAIATENAAAEMGVLPMEGADPGMPEEVGAEVEAAVAEIEAEVANEIMAEDPSIAPEEAQAMAEELVTSQLESEIADEEAAAMTEDSVGMEQTASGEDVEVSEGIEDEANADLEDALENMVADVAVEILKENPDIAPEEAIEAASELVTDQLAEELAAGGADINVNEEDLEGMEQTASGEAGEATEVPEEAGAEAEEAIEALVMSVAEEIQAESPEASEDECIEAAVEAVADAIATAQEQEAIGATGEDGEYIVPDEVVTESVEDMAKTAAANPLRDALTPVVAKLFGVDQTAFINRLAK